jgi:hypothetical protein
MDYKARFYDPYINRFIQPDTLVPNPTNPQSWNRYSYVNNSPINYSDPTGHRVDEGCGSGEQCVLPQPNDDQPQTDVTDWLFNEFSPQVEYLLENYDCSYIDAFNGARCVGYKYGSHSDSLTF